MWTHMTMQMYVYAFSIWQKNPYAQVSSQTSLPYWLRNFHGWQTEFLFPWKPRLQRSTTHTHTLAHTRRGEGWLLINYIKYFFQCCQMYRTTTNRKHGGLVGLIKHSSNFSCKCEGIRLPPPSKGGQFACDIWPLEFTSKMFNIQSETLIL